MTRDSPGRAVNRMSKCVGIILGLFAVGACAADNPPSVDAVSYFRVETVETLRLSFQNSLLTRACSQRYTTLCSVPPESEKAFEQAIAIVRLVTGDVLSDLQPPRRVESYEKTALQLANLEEQLRRAMPEYERRLYSRIEALNRVCPDAMGQKRHNVIEMSVDANFVRFWRQPQLIYQFTRDSFNQEATTFEKAIRTEWSAERCAATLDVGRSVLAEMLEKTRPFVMDANYSLPIKELLGASGEQFLRISYVLEATLHPELQDKVDSLDASFSRALHRPKE